MVATLVKSSRATNAARKALVRPGHARPPINVVPGLPVDSELRLLRHPRGALAVYPSRWRLVNQCGSAYSFRVLSFCTSAGGGRVWIAGNATSGTQNQSQRPRSQAWAVL